MNESLPPQRPASHELAGCRCPHCCYDLTGLSTLKCPECGGEFTFGQVDWRRARARFARRSTVIVPIAIVAMLAWLTATAHWLSGAVSRGATGYAYSTTIALLTLAAGLWATRGYPHGERWVRSQMWLRTMIWFLLPAIAAMKLIDAMVHFAWMTARHAELAYGVVVLAIPLLWMWHWRVLERRLNAQSRVPARLIAAVALVLLLHAMFGYRIADMFFMQFRGAPLLP